MKAFFLILSTLLPLYSPVPYIRSIVRGETKPHRTTRLVYLVIGLLTTSSLFASHDRVALWISAVSTIQAIVLFFFGMKYGVGGWSKTDIVCLITAVIGIIGWQITTDPTLGLYFGILADFMGSVPTIIKTIHHPETEEPQFYIIDAIAGGLNTLAVPTWTTQALSYPLYLLVINALIAALILRRRSAHRPRVVQSAH